MKFYVVLFSERIPKKFLGVSRGPIIKIHPKYKDDIGLLEHEKVHVRQWYAVLALVVLISGLLALLISPSLWPLCGLALFGHQLLYKFVRPYRRWCEVQAYRKQLATGSYNSTDFAVVALVEKYDLRLSADEAKVFLFD